MPSYRQCPACGEETFVPRETEDSTQDYSCQGCGHCLCDSCYEPESSDDNPEDDYSEGDSYGDEDDSDSYDDGERETVTALPELPMPLREDAPRMYLPNLPGRTVRLMSFEQEIGGGRDIAARALYDAGYSPWRDVAGYGSSSRASSEHEHGLSFVHVEDDSSCGGEIVYSRLNLNDANVARRFGDAFALVHGLRDEGLYLNMRAGFHVHIDIRGFGMRAIENLYHVHNYLEDVLYRLGSANWRAHRTEVADEDYAPLVAKGLRTRANIGQWFSGSRGGLNLSNYLGARGNCTCGAFSFADWENCTCNLRKPTAEFRWPNATTNLRKVHAYAALLQAIVALADNASDSAFNELPTNEYAGADDAMPEEWRAAVAWMGANLTMTAPEWDSLAYCFERAPFGMYADELAGMVRSFVGASSELVAIGVGV